MKWVTVISMLGCDGVRAVPAEPNGGIIVGVQEPTRELATTEAKAKARALRMTAQRNKIRAEYKMKPIRTDEFGAIFVRPTKKRIKKSLRD